MQSIILESSPASLHDLINQSKRFFIRDIKLAVSMRWDVWSCYMEIQDITNAGKSGKVCPLIRLNFKHEKHQGNAGTDAAFAFLAEHGNNLRRAFDETYARLLLVPDAAIDLGTASYVLMLPKSVRVFSPFAEMNRLTAAPAKWTVAHVIRALWNGQYSSLKCNGQYSDDYAYDAARDYGVGEIRNGRAFAEKLIEHPSGWWASGSKDSNEVSICCHHFDSNSFQFDLSGKRAEPVAAAA